LVHLGAGMDVADIGLNEIKPDQAADVLLAYPRLRFKTVLLDALARVAREKPQASTFNIAADVGSRLVPRFQTFNFCDLLLSAPFDD
jgi:hypothetical protein